LFRAVSDAVRSRTTPQLGMDEVRPPSWEGGEGAEAAAPDVGLMAYDAEVRSAFAVLLTDLARALRAFGTLARTEAESGEQAAKGQLGLALDALGEARALLTELLLVDPRDDRTQWELHGSILAAVGRVLGELDLAERDRQREQWKRDLRRRSRTAQAVGRLRDTSRQVTEVPRRQLRRRELG
jgi:hypothetical protein